MERTLFGYQAHWLLADILLCAGATRTLRGPSRLFLAGPLVWAIWSIAWFLVHFDSWSGIDRAVANVTLWWGLSSFGRTTAVIWTIGTIWKGEARRVVRSCIALGVCAVACSIDLLATWGGSIMIRDFGRLLSWELLVVGGSSLLSGLPTILVSRSRDP